MFAGTVRYASRTPLSKCLLTKHCVCLDRYMISLELAEDVHSLFRLRAGLALRQPSENENEKKKKKT